MARSRASLSRRRSLCRSAASSLTWMSSWCTRRTRPTPRPGEAATPSRRFGSSERRAGFTAAAAGAGITGAPEASETGTTPSSPRPSRELLGELLGRLRSVRAVGDDLDLVALVDLQAHDGHHALGVRLVVPPLEPMSLSYFCASLDSTAAGRACRPVGFGTTTASEVTVRPVGTATPSTAPSPAAAERGLRDVVDPRGDQARARRERREQVRVGDHDLGEQALRAGGDLVQVEADQLVTGPDPVADLDLRREALAAHLHGVQADVDQHLEVAEGADRDGVRGRVNVDDLPVARGEEVVAQRVDRDALADHLLGEDRVGHLLDRHDDARQRGLQVKTRDGRCGSVRRHGCSPSGTPPERPAVNECRADPVLSCPPARRAIPGAGCDRVRLQGPRARHEPRDSVTKL